MKKLLMTFGVFLALLAFSGIAAQAEVVTFQKEITVPGMSKSQVFEKVRTWASLYSRNYSMDAKAGTVMSVGEIIYPSPPIDRIQYSILYDMKNRIAGNKVIVTFEKVMLKSPTTYNSETLEVLSGDTKPIKERKDVLAANKSLSHIANNLEAYLLGKDAASCPLLKCPDCALLCPTLIEMQEHEKVHEPMKPAPDMK